MTDKDKAQQADQEIKAEENLDKSVLTDDELDDVAGAGNLNRGGRRGGGNGSKNGG